MRCPVLLACIFGRNVSQSNPVGYSSDAIPQGDSMTSVSPIRINGRTQPPMDTGTRCLSTSNSPALTGTKPQSFLPTTQATAPVVKTSHVYSDVDKLEGTEKVGSKPNQCVFLIQRYLRAPSATLWVGGDLVFGNSSIAKGTAIATFVHGKYESKSSGNHAALYIIQDDGGITVMDQWADDVKKPMVSSRYIRKKGKDSDGGFVTPSNNADAYSIILW